MSEGFVRMLSLGVRWVRWGSAPTSGEFVRLLSPEIRRAAGAPPCVAACIPAAARCHG